MEIEIKIYILLGVICGQIAFSYCDKPCMPRQANDSYVCVCNETYCDEITREQPTAGQYFMYVSSKSGHRLQKTQAYMQTVSNNPFFGSVLKLCPWELYQRIEGFGGSVTDAAGINYDLLPSAQLKKYLIESYFGANGIEYNMIRVPIGGCDFSTRPYAYNESPVNDTKLTNFSLAYEDFYYKIPMIHDAMEAAASDIHLVASTWSPPVWMKDPSTISGLPHLRKEYFQTYADYHLKFFEEYEKNGILFWGVTTTNEPLSGVMALGVNNRLVWDTKSLGQWIANNLGPTLRGSKYNLKVIVGDDQRFTVALWFNVVIMETPDALEYIDGVAVHFYFDDITPPEVLTKSMKDHPDKFIIYTESCTGVDETPSVLLGSWERATQYIHNIIEDLNFNVTGWIDWNLCLDENGGPNYIDNYVDAPIIVFPESGEFVKQPMFYAMAHFSKFMPRGSQRIDVKDINSNSPIEYVSVLTPQNSIVTVLHNNQNIEHQVKLIINGQEVIVTLEPKSLNTVEFSY